LEIAHRRFLKERVLQGVKSRIHASCVSARDCSTEAKGFKLRNYVCCKWFNMGACVSNFYDHDLSRFTTIAIFSFNQHFQMASPSISKTKTRKRPVTYFRSLSASEYALKLYICFNVAYFVAELLEISAISRPGQHFKDATRFHTRMSLKTSSPM
jgi:hypothetical protein